MEKEIPPKQRKTRDFKCKKENRSLKIIKDVSISDFYAYNYKDSNI